jgi:hypothetical protein
VTVPNRPPEMRPSSDRTPEPPGEESAASSLPPCPSPGDSSVRPPKVYYADDDGPEFVTSWTEMLGWPERHGPR